MSEVEVIESEARSSLGKRNTRRLRKAGKLPAVLYGHGQEVVHLSLPSDQFARLIRHGGKVCELRGAVSESALITELQWDTLTSDVLHVDLIRVSSDERIEVEVPIATRGEAPGAKEGGAVHLHAHSVLVETAAISVPEVLHLNINDLHLGGELTAKDIEDLPAGAKVLTDPDLVLVDCTEVVEAAEEEATDGSAEPEVIGRAAESEGEGE
ncbi:MAG: 50S ribosomal protein L25 [Planctomycetales bacterium]|nr:50S ribosomal protein L25 [Planctomycetales bacterium]